MPSMILDVPAPSSFLSFTSQAGVLDQDALLSPFALPPPLPRGPQLLPLGSSNDLHYQPLSSPATLDFPPSTHEEQNPAVVSAMRVTTVQDDDDAAEEDDEVRQRRLEGERRFKEAQELAAQRRRENSAEKENQQRRGGNDGSPVRSVRSSPVKARASPGSWEGGVRRGLEAWEAQERLADEARWKGRSGGGWYALLHEHAEWYAEEQVVWVRAGEDEMSIRNMERLKAEAQRGNSAAVYLLWKTLTREAYYQKAGITDARVARQLAAEHGNDPRVVDRAIELEDDLTTKQHVADLLLALSG